MTARVLAALLAAVAFGGASVAQARAVGQVGGTTRSLALGLVPRLLARPAFLLALLLNGLGFALHLWALQRLPLFLVQSCIAASVAVTAVIATRTLGLRLGRREALALLLVVVGLALLGSSARTGAASASTAAGRALLLAAVAALAALGAAAARARGRTGAVLLALVGGAGFGLVAVSARLLPSLSLAVLAEPAAYALVLAGALAFLLYALAMQRASVTTVTAALVVPQTGLPAVVGVALLGDRVRPGFGVPAVVGVLLALLATALLARFEQTAG